MGEGPATSGPGAGESTAALRPPPPDQQPRLELRHISKSFGGVQAVKDVAFSLARGEMLAMIGPNGAGKSTCFNLLNGQLPMDRGDVRLHGRSIARLKPPMRSMSWMPAIAPITEPAPMNRSALKNACVMRWKRPAP